MCGRVAQSRKLAELERRFGAGAGELTVKEWKPSYNLAPTREILAVHEGVTCELKPPYPLTHHYRSLQPWYWGFRRGSNPKPIFNARAETVATNRLFREPLETGHRLLIPVDGFYEWQAVEGRKQPHFFTRADGDQLVLAGLSSVWRPDPDSVTGSVLTATIITTAPGPDMDGVHDRQPVVLEPDLWDAWLDPDNDDVEELRAMLAPSDAGTLTHHRVDSRVGNSKNDWPELIETVE